MLTADHAGQPRRNFNGERDGAAAATSTGTTARRENGSFLSPSSSLAPLIATGNVRFTYQDRRSALADHDHGRGEDQRRTVMATCRT